MSTSLTRIEKEFILKTLLDQNSLVEMRYRTAWIQARITKIETQFVQVLPLEAGPDFNDSTIPVDLYFKFRGARMTFRSRILGMGSGGEVKLSMPEGIYRDLARNFERVHSPENVSIHFSIKGKQVALNFPKTNRYDDPSPALEAGFDASRINELLKAFREKAMEFSSENKIIMFRERKPNSDEEKIIVQTGKILLYPFSLRKDAPAEDPLIASLALTNKELVEAMIESGRELFDVLEATATMNTLKESRGIDSELYCPILYQNYVAGYLYAVSFKAAMPKVALQNRKVLGFISQFARLLSFSLKSNGYFKAAPIMEEVDNAELIDISASGLLFSLNLKEYESVFALYQDMDMTIEVGTRKIPVKARIMRKFHDRGHLYLGAKFIKIVEDDQRYLTDYLYGSMEPDDVFAASDDDSWT